MNLGRTMALDVGDARIGVALSDPMGMTAQPYCTVDQGKRSVLALLSIIAEQEVRKIVVGLPYELDGKVGSQAQKVQGFIGKVQSALERRKEMSGIGIVYWDERMTTVAAKRVLIGSGLKNKDCRSALDRVSAALILESYLGSL